MEDHVDWALNSSSYPYEVKHILRYLPSRKELLLQVLFPAADDVIPSVAKWTSVRFVAREESGSSSWGVTGHWRDVGCPDGGHSGTRMDHRPPASGPPIW